MPKRLIEAALFMSPSPISLGMISKITGISSNEEIKGLIGELRKEYENRGMEINETEEGFHMQVKPDILPKVSHLSRFSDLRDGHRRTLAIVAYKEPIRQSTIIKVQGNKAYSYIKKLEKKRLIRSEKQGRTKVIRLASGFEEYFGEDKETIKKRLEDSVKDQDLIDRLEEQKKVKDFEEEPDNPAEKLSRKLSEVKEKMERDPLSEQAI